MPDYVPLLRGNNINRFLNFDSPVFVPKQLLNEAQYVRAGDIVIAMSSGSADLVGKAAQATEDFSGGFGAFCGVIRSVSAEIHSFFGFFFQTPLYRNRAAGHGKGIGINNLQKTALQTLEIPLPPLAEQHRIVAKVDELMVLCDQLEQQQTHSLAAHQTLVETLLGTLTRVASQQEFSAAWARIASHFDTLFTSEASIDQLKQTILQLAVMGKLVPQDPNDEPALALLDRIAAQKTELAKNGKFRGSTSVAPMDPEEGDFRAPPSWLRVRFGEIMINRDGERIPVSKEEREAKAKVYDYYGASGVIDKIDDYLFDKPLLLIGEDGANLINRSTPIAFIARGQYWVNNHAHVLDGISEEFLRYIELHINAINLEKYVTGTAQGYSSSRYLGFPGFRFDAIR